MLSPRREGASSSTQVLTQLWACPDPLEGNWTVVLNSHHCLGPQSHQRDGDSTSGSCIAATWHRHSMKPTYPAVPPQTGHRVISSDVSCHHPAPPAASWPTCPTATSCCSPSPSDQEIRLGRPQPHQPQEAEPHARTRHCSPARSCRLLGRARHRAGRDRRPAGRTAHHHPAPAPRGSCSRRCRYCQGRGRSWPRPGAGRHRSGRRGCCTPGTPGPLCTECLQGWTRCREQQQSPCFALNSPAPRAWPYPSHPSCSAPRPSAHPIISILFHPFLSHSSHHSRSISSQPFCPIHPVQPISFNLFHPIFSYPILSYPIPPHSIVSHPILSHPILAHLINSILFHSTPSYPILQHPGPSHPTSSVTPHPIYLDTSYPDPYRFIHSIPLLSLVLCHPILSILCHLIPFHPISHI